MIEIIVLYKLNQKIHAILTAKGRKSMGYITLTVVLWVVFELTGFIAMGLLADQYLPEGSLAQMCTPYLFGLLGAAMAAGIGLALAKQAEPAV